MKTIVALLVMLIINCLIKINKLMKTGTKSKLIEQMEKRLADIKKDKASNNVYAFAWICILITESIIVLLAFTSILNLVK